MSIIVTFVVIYSHSENKKKVNFNNTIYYILTYIIIYRQEEDINLKRKGEKKNGQKNYCRQENKRNL